MDKRYFLRSSIKKIKLNTTSNKKSMRENENIENCELHSLNGRKYANTIGSEKTKVDEKHENICNDKKKRNKLEVESHLELTSNRTINVDTETSKKYIGAHVSIAGGLHNAIIEASQINAKAIGMFLRSQRQWTSKPLTEESVQKFNQTCLDYSFSKEMIVPHGSYLLNLGSPNDETRSKSVNLLVDELQRCDKLGIPLYNFHPGSTCNIITREECIEKIAEGINYAHSQSKSAITVIENMSCQGGTIGGQFKELRQIIDLVNDKSRVGVCLDTCHMFAAGYDISTRAGYDNTKEMFDKIVGFEFLKALHLNDSKGKLGCHLDRHEDIGRGQLRLEPFRWIVNDSQFANIPMVLETPGVESYDKAIKKLYSLISHH